MSVIPKIECRRCGRTFSGLRSRCPYCGTTRVRAGDRVPPVTSSENDGTPAAARAALNTRWQMIFGLLLLAAVVLAVIILITVSLSDAKNIAPSSQNLPTQETAEVTDQPVESAEPDASAAPEESAEPTAAPEPTGTPITTAGSIKLTYYGSEISEFTESIGETVPLEAVTYPADLEVEWTSDNESVCMVKNGQVTGIGSGMTTVTAKCGDVTAKCTVYVN